MGNKNIELLKSQNVKRILQFIRKSDYISKSRIKELTGLSFATVSAICNELVAKNVVVEELTAGIKIPGRIPKSLSIKKNAFFAICLDLQSRGICDITILDICDAVVYHGQVTYEDALKIDSIIAAICARVKCESERLNIAPSQYIGVGVAIPGIFDIVRETVEKCAIRQWDGLDIKRRFQDAFDLPVYVDNEANLRASQLLPSSIRCEKHKNIVYLHMGEGLGVGVISDGKLLRGATGYAAEISHLPIGDPNLHCPHCGNAGCAETELSKSGFIRKYASIKGLDEPGLTWDAFVEAVRGRDPSALQVMRENGEAFAKCVIILMMLFDPEEFYIGGNIVDVYSFISMGVEDKVGRLGQNYARIPILLEMSGEGAVINGIMELLISHWDI